MVRHVLHRHEGGHAGDLDGDAVYPEDKDWTGVTSTGGELKQSEVILAPDFDCTEDQSATGGIANDAPYVNCLVFVTGPDDTLEQIKVTDHGMWSTEA